MPKALSSSWSRPDARARVVAPQESVRPLSGFAGRVDAEGCEGDAPLRQGLSRQFDCHAPQILSLRRPHASPILMTRKFHSAPGFGTVDSPACDDGYLLAIDVGGGGRQVLTKGPRRGERVIAPQGLVVRRLDEDYAADLTSSFDNLYVYLPITEWRAFTADHAGGRQARLKCPDGLADPSIGALAQALAPALRQPSAADLLFIEYLLVAMLTQLLQAHGELTAPTARGGLAFWQRRRAEDMLRAALAHDISVAELAAECRLSSGYFIRAFKQSFGVTPHQWLSRARVETAMTLLVEQRMSLAEVAQSCGFSDQSHMSRVFRQHLGHPPARWRQLREA